MVFGPADSGLDLIMCFTVNFERHTGESQQRALHKSTRTDRWTARLIHHSVTQTCKVLQVFSTFPKLLL